MIRLITYSILGAIIAVFLGLVFHVGQWIGSGNLSILGVIVLGAVIGLLFGNRLNKKA
ncbi:MAG: hypothetical protein AAB638_02895 [Patescibacteria group bacterium]